MKSTHGVEYPTLPGEKVGEYLWKCLRFLEVGMRDERLKLERKLPLWWESEEDREWILGYVNTMAGILAQWHEVRRVYEEETGEEIGSVPPAEPRRPVEEPERSPFPDDDSVIRWDP